MSFIGYNDWARKNLGIQIANDLVYEDKLNDRGVFSDIDIQPHSELLQIPVDSLLTVQESSKYALKRLEEFDEENALAVLLLLERFVMKEESKWYWHVLILPEKIDSILYYSKEQMECLKGTSLYVLGTTMRRKVHTDYKLLKTKVLNEIEMTYRVNFSVEEYKWALTMVWSRFVSFEKNGVTYKAMAPVFDMFNHDPGAEMVHGYSKEKDALVLTSKQRIVAGEEVCIHYGTMCNQQLLLLYGFVLKDNPYHGLHWRVVHNDGTIMSTVVTLENMQDWILGIWQRKDSAVEDFECRYSICTDDVHRMTLSLLKAVHRMKRRCSMVNERISKDDQWQIVGASNMKVLQGLIQALYAIWLSKFNNA